MGLMGYADWGVEDTGWSARYWGRWKILEGVEGGGCRHASFLCRIVLGHSLRGKNPIVGACSHLRFFSVLVLYRCTNANSLTRYILLRLLIPLQFAPSLPSSRLP